MQQLQQHMICSNNKRPAHHARQCLCCNQPTTRTGPCGVMHNKCTALDVLLPNIHNLLRCGSRFPCGCVVGHVSPWICHCLPCGIVKVVASDISRSGASLAYMDVDTTCVSDTCWSRVAKGYFEAREGKRE